MLLASLKIERIVNFIIYFIYLFIILLNFIMSLIIINYTMYIKNHEDQEEIVVFKEINIYLLNN